MPFTFHLQILRVLLPAFFLIGINNLMLCQAYHVIMGGLGVYDLEVTNHNLCAFEYIGGPAGGLGCAGLSATPDSLLVINCNTTPPMSPLGLKEIDQMTGFFNDYFEIDWPVNVTGTGVASVGGGIFYALGANWPNNTTDLYKIDVNTGSVNNLGNLPYASSAEMTLFNGELYYAWHTIPLYYLKGIVKVDTLNPGDSELVVEFPADFRIRGLSATDICNTLLVSAENTSKLYYINLIDGVITPLCESPHKVFNVSGLVEFEIPVFCFIYLDLDNDDSSGLPEADFESDEFDCNSESVPVSDQDNHVLYDALMMEMTIEIAGFIPDG